MGQVGMGQSQEEAHDSSGRAGASLVRAMGEGPASEFYLKVMFQWE